MEGFLVFIFGGAIGSFINAAVFRIAGKEKGLISGRSRCPQCGVQLKWRDLVPLLSFLFLEGKCRNCKRKISLYYFIIEILCAAIFLGVWFIEGDLFLKVWLAFLLAFIVFVGAYDIKTLTIPHIFSLLLLSLVVLGKMFLLSGITRNDVFAAVLPFLFFSLLFVFSGGRWIGGGDIALGAVLGFWVGWPDVLVLLVAAYMLGGLVGSFLLVTGKAKRKSEIPFGPFLLAGSVIAFLWSDQIIRWYLG